MVGSKQRQYLFVRRALMDPKRLLRQANKTIADFHIFYGIGRRRNLTSGIVRRDITCPPRVNNIYFDIEPPFKRPCNMYKRSIEQYSRNNAAWPFDERLTIILRPSLFRLAAETNWPLYKRSQVHVSLYIFFLASEKFALSKL